MNQICKIRICYSTCENIKVIVTYAKYLFIFIYFFEFFEGAKRE